MKRPILVFAFLWLLLWSIIPGSGLANGMEKDLKLADDITKETIVGPGSIQVNTRKDLLLSFGATVRLIPTSESDWDFGISNNVDGLLQVAPGVYGLGKNFFKDHGNETGWVNNSYIRNETKLYFNALPRDRKWSFSAALEFDRPLDTQSVDERGGRDKETSNFGLERLNISYQLPWNMRLHAGWDIWHLDAMKGAGLVYGDDNPGFWLTGGDDALAFNVGFFKLRENDFQAEVNALDDDNEDDRDVFAGYLTYKPDDRNEFKFIYAYDRIRSAPVTELAASINPALGVSTLAEPETDSHHGGVLWTGKFGGLELFFEGVYQFGTADHTGLGGMPGPDGVTPLAEDYDINAYALAADASFEFKGLLTGFPLKPHIGILYTSGDDDPYDDKLEGYNGVMNAQRYSNMWGGENTIIGDTNLVLGSILYGYIPELYGNGTPVFTGGLQNYDGMGNGRGDNPGLTMISAGVTVAPKKYLIYKTNVNMFHWNEDFQVTNIGQTPGLRTWMDAGYVGTEWDSELTLATSGNSFIRGQAAFFFPGGAIEDVTRALTGVESDDMATRFAVEFIVKF